MRFPQVVFFLPLLVLSCGKDGSSPGAAASSGDASPSDDGGDSASSGDRGGRRDGRKVGPGRFEVSVVDPGSAEPGTPGVVRGQVSFEGTPPIRPPITAVKNQAGCHHGGDVPLAEQVIVTDGKLANVVVSVRELPDGVTAPAPDKSPYRIDQKGCLFVPHVGAIQIGRELLAENSDSIAHNVRVIASKNPTLNRTVGPGGSVDIPLEHAETVTLACDIHPWMAGFVLAFDHPYFAVTGTDGSFSIEGLPPGVYRFEAWHERYKRLSLGEITVGPGGEVEISITYAP